MFHDVSAPNQAPSPLFHWQKTLVQIWWFLSFSQLRELRTDVEDLWFLSGKCPTFMMGGLAYFPGSLRFWPSMCLTQGHIHVMSLVEQPKVSTCLEMRVWSREACQEFLSNWMWTKKGTLLTSPIITLSGLKIHRFIDFGDVQTWETGYVNPFNRGACFLWHDVWYGNASQAFFFSLGYMAKLSWRFPFFHQKNPHWQCCSPIIPWSHMTIMGLKVGENMG